MGFYIDSNSKRYRIQFTEVVLPFLPDIDIEGAPDGLKFGRFLSNEMKQIGSWKGRFYSAGRMLVAPGRFLLGTLQRVVDIAKAVFGVISLFFKNGFQLMSNILLGKPEGVDKETEDSYNQLKMNGRIIIIELICMVVSPFALVAEEIRLLIGVINPAWAFIKTEKETVDNKEKETNRPFTDNSNISLVPQTSDSFDDETS